jgi:hypothetical protein
MQIKKLLGRLNKWGLTIAPLAAAAIASGACIKF